MSMSQYHPRILAAFAAIYVLWGSTYLAVAVAVTSIPPFLLMGSRSLAGGSILFICQAQRGIHCARIMANRGGLRTAFLRWLPRRSGLCPATRSLRRGSDHPGDDTVLDRDHRFRHPSGEAGAEVDVGVPGAGPRRRRSDRLASAHSRPDSPAPVRYPAAARCKLLLGAWFRPVGASRLAGNVRDRPLRNGAHRRGCCASHGQRGLGGNPPIRTCRAFDSFGRGLGLSHGRRDGRRLCLVCLAAGTRPPTVVGTYTFVNPIIAVLLGWAILGEPLTVSMLTGGALVVGSIIGLLVCDRASAARPKDAAQDAQPLPALQTGASAIGSCSSA